MNLLIAKVAGHNIHEAWVRRPDMFFAALEQFKDAWTRHNPGMQWSDELEARAMQRIYKLSPTSVRLGIYRWEPQGNEPQEAPELEPPAPLVPPEQHPLLQQRHRESLIAKVTGQKVQEGDLKHQYRPAKKPSRNETPDDAAFWERDEAMIKTMLNQIKDRFIEERTWGYTDPKTNQKIEPITRKEALKRWKIAAQKFLAHLNTYDVDVARRFGTFRPREIPAKETYSYGHEGD